MTAACAQEDATPLLRRVDDTASPAEMAAEEALADSMLPKLDDLPGGEWRAITVREDEALAARHDAELADCLGTDGDVFADALPQATTQGLVSPAGNLVVVRVMLAPDDARPRGA